MSKADEIQERIRDAYNKYYDEAEKWVEEAIQQGLISEDEAADIVIY